MPLHIALSESSNLTAFFGKPVPAHLSASLAGRDFHGLDIKQMMQVIDFHPPFLRAERLAIFAQEKDGIPLYHSLGWGTIYPKDTDGHYNATIYLAMCGWLMASTASVHLAFKHQDTAPQVVEADKVKPLKSLEGEGILKPRVQGTTFWVETIVHKSKMKLVLATTNISFGNFAYGTIEELKFILAPKDSIWQAKEVTES